jgi:hypothetical protein
MGPFKIVAAFAGGVACTAVAMAGWSGALDSILPAAEPARSQVAAPESKTAKASKKVNGNVSSSNGNGHRAAKSNGADTAKSAAANESRCRDRAWPYLDQRCLTHATPDSTSSSQDVRIVTTDNVALPSNDAGAASKPTSSTRTADAPPQSPSVPAAPAVAQAPAAANQPQAYSRDKAETAATRRRQRKEAREQLRRERREARQERRERDNDGDRRQRDVSDRPASERYAGADAGEGHRTDRRVSRRQNGWENDDDERDVRVTQTYQMRDGRRVTVTRTFRSATDRERYEAQEQLGRRPDVRHHPAAPQAYIVAD